MLLQNWWYTTLMEAQEPPAPPLVGEQKADVAVVGAGAAGLSAALTLAEAGRDVVILERNVCGGSSTGKSAGFLTPDSELELSQLVRRFGVSGARLLWEGAGWGVERMVTVARKNRFDCDLREQDSLFLAKGRSGVGDVREELAARAQMGYPSQSYGADRLPTVLGAVGYRGAVRYQGTWGINPLLYAQGMKRLLQAKGVRVHESSSVRAVDGHVLRTHEGTLVADHVVFCADKPAPDLTPLAPDVYHAQTFLSVSEPLRDDEVRATFPDGPVQCWDSDLVYGYYRLTGDQRILLGGGSKLTTFSRDDVTSPRVIESVIRGFRRRFPHLKDLKFEQYWPGRIDATRDLMPTVAADPRWPWVHYTLGCVGLPWATFCGDLAARRVLGKDDGEYDAYFGTGRRFLLPTWLERVAGKQVVFSLSNAYAKYYEVDARPGATSPPSRS